MRHDAVPIMGTPKKVHDASLMPPTNVPYGILCTHLPYGLHLRAGGGLGGGAGLLCVGGGLVLAL